MKLKRIMASVLAASVVAGIMASSVQATVYDRFSYLCTGTPIAEGDSINLNGWYVLNGGTDEVHIDHGDLEFTPHMVVYRDSNGLYLEDEAGHGVRARLAVSSYRCASEFDVGGEYYPIDTYVLGDVERHSSGSTLEGKVVVKNIFANRAYYGKIPSIRTVEVFEDATTGYQKGLLPGDILLRGAEERKVDNVNYITNSNVKVKYHNNVVSWNYFYVGSDASIYDGNNSKVFEIPLECNAWKIVSRDCTDSVTTYTIEPTVYDAPNYTYTVSATSPLVIDNQLHQINSIQVLRDACAPTADDKVFAHGSVQIYSSRADHLPFNVTYKGTTYTTKDYLIDPEGKSWIGIEDVLGDIVVDPADIVYNNSLFVSSSFDYPEKTLDNAGFGGLFLPSVDFTKTYSTIRVENYEGDEDQPLELDNVKVFFHYDGSFTIETADHVYPIVFKTGCNSWEILKNSDGKLSLMGVYKDISSFRNVISYDVIDYSSLMARLNPETNSKALKVCCQSSSGIDCGQNVITLESDFEIDLSGNSLIFDGGYIDLNGHTLKLTNGTLQQKANDVIITNSKDSGCLYLNNVTLHNSNTANTSPLILASDDSSIDVLISGSFSPVSYNSTNYLEVRDGGSIRVLSDTNRDSLFNESHVNGCVGAIIHKGDSVFANIYPICDHSWSAVTYTWNEKVQPYQCTANSECSVNPSHRISETVNATYNVATAATCTTDGEGVWTAEFTKSPFSSQTKSVVIPATGHSFGEASYVWDEENHTCTAKRICANDPSHIETETVTATDAKNMDYWTADFENEAFETQYLRGDSWIKIVNSDITSILLEAVDGSKFYIGGDYVENSAARDLLITKDFVIDLNGYIFNVLNVGIGKDVTLTFVDNGLSEKGELWVDATGPSNNYGGFYAYTGYQSAASGYANLVLDGVHVRSRGHLPLAYTGYRGTKVNGDLVINIPDGTTFSFDYSTDSTLFKAEDNTTMIINSDIAFLDTSHQNTPFAGSLMTKVNDQGDDYKYTYTLKKATTASHVAGHALTLTDNIGVEFCLYLSSGYQFEWNYDASNKDREYGARYIKDIEVTFEWGEGSSKYTYTTTNVKKVDMGKYDAVVTVGVPAFCMNDNIHMTVKHYGTVDEALDDNYKITDYATQAATVYADDANLKRLLCDMLDYGGESQKYFNHNSANPASEVISLIDKTWTKGAEPALPITDATDIPINLSGFGLKFEGASIGCTDKTKVRLYFSHTNEEIASYATISYNGEELEIHRGSGMYYVELSNIGPASIFGPFTIVVGNRGAETTMVYDTSKYYNDICSSTKPAFEAFQGTLKAMYQYCSSARALING